MELIAYLLVIMINLNIFGAAVLFLEFIRIELSGVRGLVKK